MVQVGSVTNAEAADRIAYLIDLDCWDEATAIALLLAFDALRTVDKPGCDKIDRVTQ